MKNTSLIIQSLAVIGALSIISNPVDAKPGKGNGNGNGKGHEKHEVEHGKNNENNKSDKPDKENKHSDKDHDKFDDSERSIIAALFRPENSSKLPPGLAMNAQRGKPLPPGWQKKLSPGYRIDDEWFPSFQKLDYDHFPKVRRTPGTSLYRHENRVVRLLDATREIIDVIDLP